MLNSLTRRGDTELVKFTESLNYLLPPKPSGALALLKRVENVVILGHVGLEGLAEFNGLRSNLPATQPITTKAWTFHISDVPDDDDVRVEWLHEQWQALDAWVTEQHDRRQKAALGTGH